MQLGLGGLRIMSGSLLLDDSDEQTLNRSLPVFSTEFCRPFQSQTGRMKFGLCLNWPAKFYRNRRLKFFKRRFLSLFVPFLVDQLKGVWQFRRAALKLYDQM